MDIFGRVVQHITNPQKLVNGDEVLLVFYIVITLTFLLDNYLRRRKNRLKGVEGDIYLRFYAFYRKHTYVFINLILYFICLILLIKDEGFVLDYILTLTLSYIVYTIILKVFLKVFIDEESYSNPRIISYLNVIYYIIISAYFAFLSPYVSRPGLFLTFLGLIIGIIACFYIMVQAIINPRVLRRTVDFESNSISYAILRGMLGIVLCILLIEYAMVLSCYATDINFYGTGEGRVLNAFDMFYYLIISFTTIGYGDIYPQAANGLYYSEFAAIVIGISSLFTTTCFIAAVVSTASSIANSRREKRKEGKKGKPKDETVSTSASDSNLGDHARGSESGESVKSRTD